jgi:hypothetical protein
MSENSTCSVIFNLQLRVTEPRSIGDVCYHPPTLVTVQGEKWTFTDYTGRVVGFFVGCLRVAPLLRPPARKNEHGGRGRRYACLVEHVGNIGVQVSAGSEIPETTKSARLGIKW